uniref:Ig-like domain-containing protein n=1 Tax=Salarias fasciatus TaxID=181472 RepID=A0A672GFQ7_SALFA
MLSFILHLNLLLGACKCALLMLIMSFTCDLEAVGGTLLYVNLGDNVTLPCYYSSTANYLCWYRQVAGEQPRLIFSFYKHAPDAPTFYNSFTEKQFTLYAGDGFYHLNISDVQYSDSAMYYCGETNIKITKLNKGTFLALRGNSFKNICTLLMDERGASVTLKCTVLPGNGDAEHSVYWFKKDSAEPHLGLLYVHSHSGHCVQPSGSTAKSCVYSLSKSGVKPSDSGMYYCAVASCGEIMFGKGTNLDVQGLPRPHASGHCSSAPVRGPEPRPVWRPFPKAEEKISSSFHGVYTKIQQKQRLIRPSQSFPVFYSSVLLSLLCEAEPQFPALG